MLDRDLAALYGVETKNLNKAVRRNLDRFPSDFMFQLTAEEAQNLKFQIGTSSSGYGGRRYLPYVFTEPRLQTRRGGNPSPKRQVPNAKSDKFFCPLLLTPLAVGLVRGSARPHERAKGRADRNPRSPRGFRLDFVTERSFRLDNVNSSLKTMFV
jgi:hypothetical protein